MGGDYPVRIQSMTNTNTLDTVSTVRQIINLVDAGCELVRVTAQGMREATNLAQIKKELIKRNYNIPLIADIHYNPKAAEVAAGIVEKVRINPGNYINNQRLRSKKGKVSYSERDYLLELEEIKENLFPLINICKANDTAIRIGVNHGSLGSRIIERYGDTVEGMVMSAVEYARICNELNFDKLVLSVKASNTFVMAEAYRQLAAVLTKEGLNYPLHLGVTEAGNGNDGRLKSYVGIGTVLSYGIGDTIRVSLTEDPVNEIPVANEIVKRFSESVGHSKRRKIREDLALTNISDEILKILRQKNSETNPFELLIKTDKNYQLCNEGYDFQTVDRETLIEIKSLHEARNIISSGIREERALLIKLPANDTLEFIYNLRQSGYTIPVYVMSDINAGSLEELEIENSIHPGAIILNGLVQGICIDAHNFSNKEVADIGFGILQATRARITKTEYISCPSCGRTQFDIQKRLEEVKNATAQYKGLKIAVMGCIVNGPGEMADADYGYVGAGKGKVTLYKGKQILRQGVSESNAVKELIELIEANKK